MEKKKCNTNTIIILKNDDENEEIAVCPECNSVFSYYDKYGDAAESCPYCGYLFDGNSEKKYIGFPYSSFLSEYLIETTEDSLIITATIKTPDFWDVEYGEEIEYEEDNFSICINHKTGTTISYEGASKVDYSNGLSNSSDPILCMLDVDEFKKDFRKFAPRIIKRNRDFFDKVIDDELFDYTFIANRYPFFSKEQLDKIIHSENASNVYGIIRKISFNDEPSIIIEKLELLCGVKFSKKVIKMFINDPTSAYDMAVFSEVFSNIDLLGRFIENKIASLITDESIKVLAKDLVLERGEVETFNFLLNAANNVRTLQDTAYFYTSLKNDKKLTLPKHILKGNLVEIHDRASSLLQENKYPDLPINYSYEEQTRYCKIVNDVLFLLPETTHELIKVGQRLHNCVGNYGDKAVSKESIIVFMKQDNDFVGCIEIDGSGKFAVQAKGPCNQSLSEPLLSYLKKYAGMINLSLERCDDVYDDYDDYYMDDYHELELDADGNVIHI